METVTLNTRELATVLAALRLWRQQLRKHGIALTNGDPHFSEERPLSEKQIDRLCEQLNEPATRQLASRLAIDRRIWLADYSFYISFRTVRKVTKNELVECGIAIH